MAAQRVISGAGCGGSLNAQCWRRISGRAFSRFFLSRGQWPSYQSVDVVAEKWALALHLVVSRRCGREVGACSASYPLKVTQRACVPFHHKQRYIVLSENDIHERQEEAIRRVSSIFSIPRESACILLRHYKWNISKLSDEWFADEERVRHFVGLPTNGAVLPDCQELTCGICFEGYSTSALSSAGCVHLYCHECWEGYISASINDGPGCLSLRCPEPSCTAMVLEETINRLAKDEEKVKYKQFLSCSYVEDNKKCTEETHRPVSCETVSKWILKNSAESENVNWFVITHNFFVP
ncbi:putative E3 ubiquitin-protein ligase ARI8 [Triticum urartu]|uniref:RBR-type E3 ubiquitin transferase n=1 Tax=Triticum urartu TaxID=4572 RepID=M8A4W0_TRIUA|nr:putative E3 ubiquitin-protein ligase ARI8 [Triticum urartu]